MLNTIFTSPILNKGEGGGGTETKVIHAPDRFVPWGDQTTGAKGEGWYPAQWDSEGTTVYRNTYNPGMNTVAIPGDKNYGHMAAVGYKNGLFDLVIRDSNGNIKSTVKKGVSPQVVRQYFTNQNSPIQKRVSSIIAGQNPDRASSGGGYAALYNPDKIK